MILTRAVSFEGRGLHGGRDSRVEVRPARPGAGLSVIVDGRALPIASLEMSGRGRSTVLEDPGSAGRLGGVEHLLAALSGLDVWDASIACDGDEVPVLDGSALPYARELAPVLAEGPAPEGIAPSEPVRVGGDEAWVQAVPAEHLVLDVDVEFPHPLVGAQRLVWSQADGRPLDDLFPARTFGFLEELADLRERGLAAGGGLDCALVYGDGVVLNPEGTRFVDEPVRHKALDLLGDLALLGRPALMHVRAHRPSHALNHELVRLVRRGCHGSGRHGKVDV